MNIIIFGATGSVGSQLLEQALTQGHNVTAFARSAGTITLQHPHLTLHPGDVLDFKSVKTGITNHDAVLIALGNSGFNKVRSLGTQNIIKAMQQLAVPRLICQTTLGAGDSAGNLNFFWKYIMFGLLLRHVYVDHVKQEALIQSSDLDWVIVRPSAFTDGAVSNIYKHGFGATQKQLSLKISRADVADFMLKQLSSDHYLKQTPGVSN